MSRPITVVGYGRFGRALVDLMLEAGHDVVVVDPYAEIPSALLPRPDAPAFAPEAIVVMSVPVVEFREVLLALRAQLHSVGLVMDVSSVRAPAEAAMTDILGSDVPWVGTHPLFGPSSIAAAERPLQVVVCPNRLHRHAADSAVAFYRALGCEVVQEDSENHDRVMAYSHAMVFFIAKGMLDIGADERIGFVPPSFKAMLTSIDAVRQDAGHLFYAIERMNPYAEAAREEFMNALARLHDELAATDPIRYRSEGGFVIEDASTSAPELRETRELIDELDRDLVRMISRRAELARRAGRIKGGKGLPIRDASRERSLLDDRRAWGEDEALDGDSVRRIFEAILALSRGVQESA